METSLPEENNVLTHQQAREHGHELLRRNVVEAAGRLLEEEGPEALTVRRIAQELACSTKVIYTMFKGKDGLADALYQEGCLRLSRAVGQVAEATNPALYAREVAWAYWNFALANRSYYMVMFCGAIPNFQPSNVSIRTTLTAFERVIESIQHYMDHGLLPQNDVQTLVKALWAPLHGVISLYFMHQFSTLDEAKDVFMLTLHAITESLLLAKE